MKKFSRAWGLSKLGLNRGKVVPSFCPIGWLIYPAEEKIRIVLDGLKGEDSTAELCRREGIAQSLNYNWSKEFPEAGRKRLAGAK